MTTLPSSILRIYRREATQVQKDKYKYIYLESLIMNDLECQLVLNLTVQTNVTCMERYV